MESLGCPWIGAICFLSSNARDPSVHVFAVRLTNNICKSREPMNLNSKASNSGDTSVRPLESSELRRFDNTLPSREVLDVWRNADAVCFDVDSTVCVDEGIDEQAEFCGAGKAVVEWTTRAMGGSVPFEEALAARLALFKPSLSRVQDFLTKNPPSSGEFMGFDANEPTSRSGGKATAVQLIRKARGYNSLVMIGDGATDLKEASEMLTDMHTLAIYESV